MSNIIDPIYWRNFISHKFKPSLTLINLPSPTLERSTHGHTSPTMSPTHSAISGVFTHTCGRNNSTTALNPSSALSMIPHTFHFIKDYIPISLTIIQPISETAERKKDGFYQLVSAIYGVLKLHYVANLILLIACEFPTKHSTPNRR